MGGLFRRLRRRLGRPAPLAALALALAAILAVPAVVAIVIWKDAGRPPVPAPAVPAPVAKIRPLPQPEFWAVRPQDLPPHLAPRPPAARQPTPEDAAALPAWRRFAVPAATVPDRPLVAVVIDDLGMDRPRTTRALALPGPLTMALLPYAGGLPELAVAAREAGHELLVHLPMQAMDMAQDPGPNALLLGLAPDELRTRLHWNLDRFEGYVGVNNHMGSRFTADAPGMGLVLAEIARRGLLFLDSKTTAASVGSRLAREMGVPEAARDVFIDHDGDRAAVAAQLALLEAAARRHGAAIGIGHPHDNTVEELRHWLPTLEDKGLTLVPVSAIVARRQAGG